MDKTNDELAKILAEESINIAIMEMDIGSSNTFDRKYFAFFHLGAMAVFRLYGKSNKDVMNILHKIQRNMDKLEKRMSKSTTKSL